MAATHVVVDNFPSTPEWQVGLGIALGVLTLGVAALAACSPTRRTFPTLSGVKGGRAARERPRPDTEAEARARPAR